MQLYKNLNAKNTALLVIDPVNSCAHEKCEIAQYGIRFLKIRKMLPRLNAFMQTFRKEIGGLVVIATITPWREEFLPANLNELYTDPETAYYSQDASGFDEKLHTIRAEKRDVVITKNTYDAFTNTGLVETLHKKGIAYIVVTGVFTDGCVLASVIGGFAKGFNFVILKDLIETTDSAVRQKIQKLLIDYTFPKMYGKTIESQEFLHEMRQK